MTELIKRDDAPEPCPFCGNEMTDIGFGLMHTKEVENCPITHVVSNLKNWNTRALPAIDPAAIREAALQARIEELLKERDEYKAAAAIWQEDFIQENQRLYVATVKLAIAVDVIKSLLERDEENTCQHENTERGGVLWEICLDCGCKWADDEGGKPVWKDPQEWVDARALLAELEGKE